MKSPTTFKCLHCGEKHIFDPRNRGRQHHCSKPECQRASKAASQRRWKGKPENKNYFSGVENCERVRQWREAHPGYWRKRKLRKEVALQETLKLESLNDEEVTPPGVFGTLQDVCQPQPALIVGLISIITGCTLQEDIAASARWVLNHGEDILGMAPEVPHS